MLKIYKAYYIDFYNEEISLGYFISKKLALSKLEEVNLSIGSIREITVEGEVK